MPQIIYPNELEIQGPILIGEEALFELDRAISEALPKLAETQSQLIEEEVNARLLALPRVVRTNQKFMEERRQRFTEEITAAFAKQEMLVKLHFSDDSELHERSFREAAKHERLSERTVMGFEVNARSGKVRAHVECFNRRLGSRLTLEVSPSYEAGRDLFIALRRWVKNIEAPFWQRKWHQLGGGGVLVVATLMAMLLATFQIVLLLPSSSYYRHQAEELAKTGVKTPENEKKALELLLMIAARSSPPPSQSPWRNKRFILVLVGLAFVLLVAAFPPKLVIGLGHQGEARLKHWRWWIKFVSVTVPGFLITGFFLPYVIDAIKRLWS
jgi:hypothetical protein